MSDTIFADADYAEKMGLNYWDYLFVSDPIKDNKGGTLTLYDINTAFMGNIAKYELVVNGTVYTVKASAVKDGMADFKLPKMSSGDKQGMVYAVDAKGNRSEGVSVFFDVDDKTAPVLSGKLGMVQTGNDFNFSWNAATDDSEIMYKLVIKDGKNVVYPNAEIDGSTESFTVNLSQMGDISGKKLSAELIAYQENYDKGVYAPLLSKTLKASAAIADLEAPTVAEPGKVFADMDHAISAKLQDYYSVSDPIKDNKGGTLTLYGIDTAFNDNVAVAKYELVVNGTVYTVNASAVKDGMADFKLPKMSPGDKQGMVYAVDAKGNRSEGVSVFFEVDDKTAPVLSGKLSMIQEDNRLEFTWNGAKDDSEIQYQLVIKDGKNVVCTNTGIDGDLTAWSVDLSQMGDISGKTLSAELIAYQENYDKGVYAPLLSKTLKASAKVTPYDVVTPSPVIPDGDKTDSEAPVLQYPGISFADFDYAEKMGLLSLGNFFPVGDPIDSVNGGVLSLYDINYAFTDNVGITDFELFVDGTTYKATAADVRFDSSWEGLVLDFELSGISAGEKTGYITALDAAGNRSSAIAVHFDVDSKPDNYPYMLA